VSIGVAANILHYRGSGQIGPVLPVETWLFKCDFDDGELEPTVLLDHGQTMAARSQASHL
jgi:hypothetical protein